MKKVVRDSSAIRRRSPMGYHDKTTEKTQSNFAKMLNQMSEQIFLICKEEL